MSLFAKTPKGIKNAIRERYDSVKRLMWIKCEKCEKLVYYKEYVDNLRICPRCGHAFTMTAKQRFDLFRHPI